MVLFNSLGLGENGLVLDSAEFLDLNTKKWTKTSSLKVGRTEHVMSLVYGIPTVIGGNYDSCTLLMMHIPINNFDIPLQRRFTRCININVS